MMTTMTKAERAAIQNVVDTIDESLETVGPETATPQRLQGEHLVIGGPGDAGTIPAEFDRCPGSHAEVHTHDSSCPSCGQAFTGLVPAELGTTECTYSIPAHSGATPHGATEPPQDPANRTTLDGLTLDGLESVEYPPQPPGKPRRAELIGRSTDAWVRRLLDMYDSPEPLTQVGLFDSTSKATVLSLAVTPDGWDNGERAGDLVTYDIVVQELSERSPAPDVGRRTDFPDLRNVGIPYIEAIGTKK